MNLSSIAKQSVIYLAGDTARRLVAVIMIPFYTRFLMPAEYGTVELIDLFVMVATLTFGVMAVSDAMVRIYHECGGVEGTGGSVISTAIWTCALLSGAILGLAVSLAEPVSWLLFHSPQQTQLVRFAFAAVFLGNLAELGLIYQRIRQRPGLFVAISLAQLLLNVGFNVWFIAFRGMGVWGFLFARLISSGASAAVTLVLAVREVGLSFSWERASSMVRFGAPLILSGVSIFIIHFSDRFFLSWWGSLAQVGVYALAYKIGFLVTYSVGEPFGRVWGVSLYGYVSEPSWKRQFARVFRYLVFALFSVALTLSIFSNEGLALISNKAYLPAAALVAPIAFGYALREAGDFFRGVLFINRRTRLFGMISMCCAALNIGLNFWLIPSQGPAGAAWATFLTWFCYLAASWVAAMREHSIPYSALAFMRLALGSFLIYFLTRLIPGDGALLQWCAKTMLLATFVAIVWLSGYFPANERKQIRWYIWRRCQSMTGPVSRLSS